MRLLRRYGAKHQLQSLRVETLQGPLAPALPVPAALVAERPEEPRLGVPNGTAVTEEGEEGLLQQVVRVLPRDAVSSQEELRPRTDPGQDLAQVDPVRFEGSRAGGFVHKGTITSRNALGPGSGDKVVAKGTV